jgi:hypothetical protein
MSSSHWCQNLRSCADFPWCMAMSMLRYRYCFWYCDEPFPLGTIFISILLSWHIRIASVVWTVTCSLQVWIYILKIYLTIAIWHIQILSVCYISVRCKHGCMLNFTSLHLTNPCYSVMWCILSGVCNTQYHYVFYQGSYAHKALYKMYIYTIITQAVGIRFCTYFWMAT